MTIICKITCHDCKIKIEETEWSFQTLILKSMNCRILLIQNINTHISLIMTTLVHILKLKDIYTLTIDIGIQTTLAFHLKAVYICFVVKPNTTSIYISNIWVFTFLLLVFNNYLISFNTTTISLC